MIPHRDSSPPPEQPALPLRLVASDGPRGRPPKVTARSTLSELYYWAFKTLWLDPQQANAGTYEAYEHALAHWKKLSPAAEDDREPALDEIDDYVVSRFLTRLAGEPGNKPGTKLAIATIRKHATSLNKLLAFAGQRTRSRHGYKNLGLLELPPLVDKPRADVQPPDGDFTLDEFGAMWRAAAKMQTPRRLPGISACTWWRSILMVALLTGLRRGQLLGLHPDNLSGAYIRVLSGRSKGRRGKLQYLAPAALEALESLRRDGQPFFVWPHYRKCRRDPDAPPIPNIRHLDAQLERLARLAGITMQRCFGWNGFRKLSLTTAHDIAGAEGAQAMGGHSRSGTAMAHYVNGLAQSRRAEAVINQFPTFKQVDDSRQGKLFD